jgi:MoaE-MoaD fusion protein
VKVEVLYFAVVRERAGRESESFTLDDGATVGDLLARLGERHPALAALERRVQIAVNRHIVPSSCVLADGDEVALIPPVSGGAEARPILLSHDPLSLAEVAAAVEDRAHGAVATFTGNVRRSGSLADVVRLEYEAYEPMAREVLTAIAREITLEYPGVKVAIHHRLGTLVVGEAAVIIAASAPHRAEAFAACRVAIERLKQRAPIWKKEVGPAGEVWVGMGP